MNGTDNNGISLRDAKTGEPIGLGDTIRFDSDHYHSYDSKDKTRTLAGFVLPSPANQNQGLVLCSMDMSGGIPKWEQYYPWVFNLEWVGLGVLEVATERFNPANITAPPMPAPVPAPQEEPSRDTWLKIVGLKGRAGSGKNTAADFLLEQCTSYGIHCIELSFANPLKNAVSEMFQIPRNWCDNQEDKAAVLYGFNFTLREALQKIGTEVCRQLDQDIWLKLIQLDIAEIREQWKAYDLPEKVLVVITDVRFQNEQEWAKKEGTLVHIRRPHPEGLDAGIAAHQSEQELEAVPADWFIMNLDTKERLEKEVLAFFVDKILGAKS